MPPPPTLRDLIDFFWAPGHPPLPTEIDPSFRDRTVEGLPVCGDQTTSLRLLGYPNDPNSAIFLPPNQITPTSTFLSPDSTFLRRILTGTDGLTYQREEAGPNHTMVPAGRAILDLCRDSSPLSGAGASARYAVYVTDRVVPVLTDDDIMNNHPDVPALREIANFDFQRSEIIAIIRGLSIDRLHFGVNQANRARLMVMPEDSQIQSIIRFVQSPNSPIAADRRAAIVTALQQSMAPENEQRRMMRDQGNAQREGLDLQRGMRTEMRWQMLGMGALTVYSTLLALGKAGGINTAVAYPLRGIYNLFRAPFDGGAGLARWWSEPATALRYRGLSTVVNTGTNLTEMARQGELRTAADPTTPRMAEMIENRINAPVRAGSAIFEAPPGWGKQVLMEQLAIRNPNTVFVQVTPDGLMGGTMYRGSLEQRLKDIPAEIERALKNGQRVVLCIDEFHEAALAGKSMEETRTLLERWKGPLAQGTLRIVGFSTPQEMIKVRYAAGFYGTRERPTGREHLNPDERLMVEDFDRDPTIRPNIELRALLNRFQRISAIDNGGIRPASDIELMIREEVAYQKSHNNLTINITDEAITEIARLSISDRAYEGYIPRTSFAIFDGVLTQQAEAVAAGQPVPISMDNIHNFVRTTYPAIASRLGLPDGPPPPPSGPRVVTTDPSDPAPRDPSTRVVAGADDPAPRPVLRVVGDAPATPPVVPAVTGTTVTSIFTEDSFYEMFRSRYPQFQNSAGQVHGNYEVAVRAMARLAFNRWNADPAHPTTTVEGHVFPRESFVEQTFRDAIRIAAQNDAAQSADLRRVFEAGRERLGEGRGLDTTSESFRAEGLRAFEAIGR